MARTRLLKPDFFIDPDLGEVSIWARMAFAGLWCYADKAGRLKYEPKKLKVIIFPYDTVNIDKIIIELTQKPFVNLYEVNGVKYLQITNWDKHQTPHHTEKDSTFPEFNGYLTVKQPLDNGSITSLSYKVTVKEKVKVTMPPTIEEIKEYCKDKGLPIDADKFFNYYESNGWKVGKNPMKSWSAACHTWARNNFGDQQKEDKYAGIPMEWRTKK